MILSSQQIDAIREAVKFTDIFPSDTVLSLIDTIEHTKKLKKKAQRRLKKANAIIVEAKRLTSALDRVVSSANNPVEEE